MTASLNGAQGSSEYSLDGVPGDSPIVSVRLAKADQARLAALAKCFGVPLSRVMRVAVVRGLVGIETSGELPADGQGAAPDQDHDAPAG